MEILHKMMESIDYIEERIDHYLEIDTISKVACWSRSHFQRMFHMLTGITVAEYIRKKRMTLAVQELLHSDCKVIDVALR